MSDSAKWILWQRADKAQEQAQAQRERRRESGASLWERQPAEEEAAPPAAERPADRPAGADRRGEAAAQPPGGSAPSAYRPSAPAARTPPSGTPGEHDLIRRIVTDRNITVQFQPIRDVVRDQVVGFEALTRGPEGPLLRPDRLFAAARLAGLAGELDWICRAEAFRQMLEAKMPPAVSLFVNVEPDSLIEPCPDDLLQVIWDATSHLRVFIDMTGRALSQYPFEVLETVRRARAAGWGVAMGDLEFSSSGIALLPTLEPDVVKMNHGVLTVAAGYAAAAVTAVLSEVEQTGAMLLVERVEDEAARRISRSVGASLHSGRLFGYPEKLPTRLPTPVAPVRLRDVAPTAATEQLTPWKVLAERGAHVASGVTLAEIDNLVRIFALQAASAPNPPVIGLVVPNADESSEETTMSFRMLLGRCPLVLAVGHRVSRFEDWRVRAGELPAQHPLLDEFCAVALSPTQAMAIVARRVPGMEVTADLAVSQQPAACRELMRLITDTLDTLHGGVRYGHS
jgi:EAL domain-containing protein (putative c-di-GMP-specific phosphodiesterase class I)